MLFLGLLTTICHYFIKSFLGILPVSMKDVSILLVLVQLKTLYSDTHLFATDLFYHQQGVL